MGELATRAGNLERQIVLIVRELNEKKDEVAGLAAAIKYIAEQAERLEVENERLKKDMQNQERTHAEELKRAAK